MAAGSRCDPGKQLPKVTPRPEVAHCRLTPPGYSAVVLETRPKWPGQYEFHHDLRTTIRGKPVYIETQLNWRCRWLLTNHGSLW
jgi:hypothetical protein